MRAHYASLEKSWLVLDKKLHRSGKHPDDIFYSCNPRYVQKQKQCRANTVGSRRCKLDPGLKAPRFQKFNLM